MPFPVVFQLGPLAVSAHVIFETLAFFLGFRYFLFLRKRSGDSILEENRIWIFIGATAGALLGSRVLGALESPSSLRQAASPLLYLFSSKTIVGGLLGGLAGVEGIKKMIGETRSSGDLFTYPLILGMIIGRIGCFLNGTAESVYGMPTEAWPGMDLGDGIPRHPVALYEIAFLIQLWACIAMGERPGRYREGMRFRLFMTGYLGFRFLLEFLKPREAALVGLSAIQIGCLTGLIYYRQIIFTLIFNRRNFNQHAGHP